MDGTIIQQGTFTGTNAGVTLSIRSDVDWMKVYNYSNIGGAVQNAGTEFYWQRGFVPNDGVVYFHAGASQVVSVSTALVGIGAGAIGGFTLVDSSIQTPGPKVAITAISTANPPVVDTASTAGLSNGDVVLLTNTTGAPQFGGYYFQIGGIIANTSFTLPTAPQLAVAATAGFYRKISFDPIFYPRRRLITAIDQLVNASVQTSVPHGLTVGQQIRFTIPAIFGMVELDGVQATVIAVPAPTEFFVNVDTTAFTAFTFPLAADVPFTPAEVVPIGENTSIALAAGTDILGDATLNTGFIGMVLAGGAASPGGANGNIMYWVAGKSFNV